MTKRRNAEGLVDEAEIEVPGDLAIITEEVAVEAPAATEEEEEAPIYVPWDAFDAKIVEPTDETEVTEETQASIPDGHVRVTYIGLANVIEHGEFKLRAGVPVDVPSDVAEELLTMPFESFKIEE